ncbi:MAG: TetR/AcrR family transcriptional regulator [Alphaproteobacteria bacterium]|nr:TetR/AcrR family transcriptional regulator [Alphaproteobacteria bacterium]
MERTKHRRQGRRGYHHGNLKEALVSAARQLILEKGPHGFSLIEAARMADVSPAAPYRHFRDRRALLAEIARLGYEKFSDRLETAWNDGLPDPADGLRRMGEAYIDFALEDRASYAAMFEAGLTVSDDEALKEAGQRAYRTLALATETLTARLPEGQTVSPELVFFHIWSLTHGAVTLFRNDLQSRALKEIGLSPALDSGIEIYLRGLGSVSPGVDDGAQ